MGLGLGLGPEQRRASGGGTPPYIIGASTFDGSTYLTNAAMAWTNTAYWSQVTWVFLPSVVPGQYIDVVDAGNDEQVATYVSLQWEMDLHGVPLGSLINYAATYVAPNSFLSQYAPAPTPGVWLCKIETQDHSTSPPTGKVYLNGVDVTHTEAGTAAGGGSILDLNGKSLTVGGYPARPDISLIGSLAVLWMSNQSLMTAGDIPPAMLAKFRNPATGKPVDLGADGSTPTGTAPGVYLTGGAATFATNLGTAGSFAVTGTLTNAASSPSD